MTVCEGISVIYIDKLNVLLHLPYQDSQEDLGEVLTVEQDSKDRLYLDLVPVRSFLHTSGRTSPQSSSQPQAPPQTPPQPPPRDPSPTEASAEEPQESTYQVRVRGQGQRSRSLI